MKLEKSRFYPACVCTRTRELTQCCGAESRGAESYCLLGAGAEITNCGFGPSSTFLFIKDLKRFYRKKSWLLTVLRIQSQIPDPAFFHSGSRILIFSIPDPDPGSASKNLSILTPKNGKSCKLLQF
jgi:hypothetical protein